MADEVESVSKVRKGGVRKDLRAGWIYEFHDEIEPTLEFFYKPRTITIVIAYTALFVTGDDVVVNTKLGLAAGFGVILMTGLLEFKDGPFIRPHPALWRVVLAVSVAYEILLVFVLFQDKSTMRSLLKYIDPKLGVPLPEKSYAENCEITKETLWDQMDIFVFAHTFVMFEIMEYSLQHQLPNFAECWWDHHYSWRGINEIPSYQGKIQRTIEQFTPHSWTKFEWKSTKNLKTFLAVIGLLSIELQLELNAFYLKYLLWIPSEHYINIGRLLMYFFLCMPAVREAYQYLTDEWPLQEVWDARMDGYR
ncbi:hypothetical protein HDU76_007067 [Blyttiomyces sp. JEL0837]|nr:hypothetical protein HDU76_007067 [Blyttiomyces sp. JEL0837]